MNQTGKNELYHYGVKGMKWGVRRYQNKDGTYTEYGKIRKHYEDRTRAVMRTTSDANKIVSSLSKKQKKMLGMRKPNEKWIREGFESEYSERLVKRFIQKYEGIPVSMLEIEESGNIIIATDKKYQGKGFASKNVEKAKQWLNSKANVDVNYLTWHAYAQNKASNNLAKKMGFKEIGRGHDHRNGYEDVEYILYPKEEQD